MASFSTINESQADNIFKFQDYHLKVTPDPNHDYPASLKNSAVPLVIDNGSCFCRAGWATDASPRLTFRNVIAKQRGKKDWEAQVGNDISNIEVVRWLLKTQFDHDVVTQYDSQELIFDHLFSHLGINTEGAIHHPIVLTETACNPNYCRQLMSELLFECYHVPKIAYGVDSLFSYYYRFPDAAISDGLVLSSGYQTTHILPIVQGRIDAQYCKRINVGGCQATGFLHRLLQLKYPAHFAAVNLSRAEELMNEHTYMATDYGAEVDRWMGAEYYNKNAHKIQLPYTPLPGWSSAEDGKKERRQQQIKRLQEVNAKRRQERLASDQEKLQQLKSVLELQEEDDDESFLKAVEEMGYTSAEELVIAINKLSASIQRVKDKIQGIQTGQENVPQVEQQKSFSLLSIPDEQLTEEQLEQKKRQRVLKNLQDSRLRAKQTHEDCKELMDEGLKLLEENKEDAFQAWVERVRKIRQELVDSRSQRQELKSELTKRRSMASQQRMRTIAQLAQEKSGKKGKEDTFGMNDEDWDVYKEINKDGGDSDSEAEQEKLSELEQILRDFDPKFEKQTSPQPAYRMTFDLAEYYQVHLGVERIRAPEVMFQPSLIGLHHAGLAETLQYVLSKYDSKMQDRLVQRIYLTGGNMSYPNLQQRLETELLAMRPFQSTFQVFKADKPSLDAWNGAKKWAQDANQIASGFVTKAEYEEKGGEYLKEHVASNLFTSTPSMTR
ncbi:actin-related protein 5-like isoform X2 [Amphiura filiformis]|uniref:actin-related protein 5-like isoform X2 n=1 Tax=Amphiura filiformis TaxID=82378 RepID=UPI003B225D23